MRKAVVLLLLVLLLPYATALSVEKVAEKESYDVGEMLKVYLVLKNEDARDVNVRIKDSVVMEYQGNKNGVEIQCYEATVPANSEIKIAYPDITLYYPGEFDLGKAEVSYSNGKVMSNDLKIKVKGSLPSYVRSEVKTIYRCNGMSMQYTQVYSSYTPSQISQNPSSQQSSNPLTNNQMAQNTQVLKNLYQRKVAKRKMLEQQLMNSSFYKNLKKEMAKKGFNLSDMQANEEGFNMNFSNGKDLINVQGSWKDLEKLNNGSNSLLFKNLENLINSSKLFKLQQEGYNLSSYKISYNLSSNASSYNLTYANSKGEKLNVFAKFNNQSLVELRIEKPKKKNWLSWLFLGLFFAFLFAVIYWKWLRTEKHTRSADDIVHEPKKDLWEEVRDALDKAKIHCKEGRIKKSLELISMSLRKHYKQKLNLNYELDGEELLKHINDKDVVEIIKTCEDIILKPKKKKADCKMMIEKVEKLISL